MRFSWCLAAMLALPGVAAAEGPGKSDEASATRTLSRTEAERLKAIFAAIRADDWTGAAARIDAEPAGPLASYARAELYTAKGSPKVELQPLLTLLATAPTLPQAEQIARLAQVRGAVTLPTLPAKQRLIWYDGAPVRTLARPTRADVAADALAAAMAPLVKEDRAEEAEQLLDDRGDALTPEARTEWGARVAWIYYLVGDDRNARRMADKARAGSGDWAPQAEWTAGLAAWRMADCDAADRAFRGVGQRADNVELRAAGLYWSSRAAMACARPQQVQPQLRAAAGHAETFYGQLAREALGMSRSAPEALAKADARAASREDNVRIATALAQIGELDRADTVLRHQARIGPSGEHAALATVAAQIDLPATQLWLCHNRPQGVTLPTMARYPAPRWTPDGGWRVDKSLVYAHTLQESRFRTEVESPAGAFGLMQIMPAAATDYERRTGLLANRDLLRRPEINMAVGQSHIEALRDRTGTGGLLPKVIAAFNAGPSPVERWNLQQRDKGDPLLYIESIPYWETRFYVATVLRNYWMYQEKGGEPAISRTALTQGLWPRFPGLAGAKMVRLDSISGVASAH